MIKFKLISPLRPAVLEGDADFEAPFTVEVYDRDAAKDSLSKIIVQLATTDGAKIDVERVISTECTGTPNTILDNWALEDGRFIGQVILQLGSKKVPTSSRLPPACRET